MRGINRIVLLSIFLGLFVLPGYARAMPQNGWEIEGHGGMVLLNPSGEGDLRLPAPGPTFSAAGGTTSRIVPSWYFGDGALLLNQVADSLDLPSRMTPIDTELRSDSVSAGGFLAGFRVSRRFSSRLSGEFNFDYDHNALRLRGETKSALEASLNRFVTVWDEVFDSHEIPAEVTSSRSEPNSGGKSMLLTGTINVDLPMINELLPYLVVGGGYAIDDDEYTLELDGTYDFVALTVPIRETTNVLVNYKSESGPLFVVGGGIKREFSPGWGIRADVRVHIGGNRVDTTVSTTTDITPGTPEAAIALAADPTVQFRSTPNIAGSLNALPTPPFVASEGAGTSYSFRATLGIFRRF